ncbi:recombinase family protein [uncultured Clostridium sp.]|uniref:recombinase family protein n=1 Tax=uncultured Clostridium sp. TaxID=59620 RepID=UPI00258AEF7C|nr:recombinase family protein [uncultured Clostridium sp.]
MKRVATFSRVSTEMDSQKTSILNQEEIYNNWIEKNNYILYKSYIDDGISGTKAYKRVEWLKMLEDGKNKKYDILLCKSYSRFGRNMIETLGAIKELRENGIRIIFIEDSLDSEADSTKFGLFSWISEQESQNTSKRIKTVFEHFKEVGKIYNCIAPYGYDYDSNVKNFIINEEEARTVRRVFKLYLQGNGTNKIASMLVSEGVPSKKGGTWRGNTIKNMILNEVYLGTLVQNKSQSIDVTIKKVNKISKEEWIKHYNNHEAIIDEETFLRANNIFKSNSEKAHKARFSIKGIERASNVSLFSNLLKCSCGSSMGIRRKKNRKPYYNCVEYEKIGLACGHQSNFIQEEVLIDYIKEKLNNMIESKFDSIEIVDKNDVKISLENELQSINKQIDKQIMLSNNLLNLYSDGTISAIQFKLQNESISNTLNTLINNKEVLEDKINNIPKNNVKNFKKDVESIVKVPVEKWSNSMIKEVIKKIEISTNGVININWKVER